MNEDNALRRQLRATAVVNRQLLAQLEGQGATARGGGGVASPTGPTGPTSTSKVRRSGVGDKWLSELAPLGRGQTFLVRRAKGSTYLIEGGRRRRVKSGLLVGALEAHLGPRREVSEAELDAWTDGPPVEVLEGPSGPPFLAVGGERLPLRGLPVPYPVSEDAAAALPQGKELTISARALAIEYTRSTLSPRALSQRVTQATKRRGGFVPAAKAFARRQLRRLRPA